jgi:hypothetical protein
MEPCQAINPQGCHTCIWRSRAGLRCLAEASNWDPKENGPPTARVGTGDLEFDALQAHHGAVLNTKKRLSSSLRRGGQGAACQQFKGLSLLFIHTPCCSSVYQPFHGPVARPDELGRKPSRLKLPAQDGFHRLSLVFAAHEKHDVVRRIEG